MNAIKKLKRFLDEGFDPLDREMQSDLEDVPAPETAEEYVPKTRKGEPGWFKSAKTVNLLYAVFSVLLCAAMIAVLLYNIGGLPSSGGADTLVDSKVGRFYIENGLGDTGAVNIVTPIILSYRGFDTLGESHVLFIALCAVLMLLRYAPSEDMPTLRVLGADADENESGEDEILKSFGRVVVALIFVFGLYVILNGNISPGGGFSGGAVLGAGCILYLNAYGQKAAAKFLNIKSMRAVTASALVSYSLFKGYHFICGYNGAESIFSNGTPGTIFSGGMMLFLNVFVGAVVMMTMYTLFVLFRKGDF